jgi:hypothetical protein
MLDDSLMPFVQTIEIADGGNTTGVMGGSG